MKRIILLFLLLFLASCWGGSEEETSTPSDVTTESPQANSEISDNNQGTSSGAFTGTGAYPYTAVEVEEYEDIESDFGTRYQVKNDTFLSKNIIDSIIYKCKYFEGEVNYTYESGEKQEYDQPFTLKTFLYEAIEEGWCPGNETKAEKYVMADKLLENEVPEKMVHLKDIKSIDDIDIEKLNFDTSKPGYKREILTFLALYMVTIDESDVEEYNKYMGYYNDLVIQISEEEGRGNEELYYPILIATSQKPGGCSKYVEENIVNYK